MRTFKKILLGIMLALPAVGFTHPGHGHGNPLGPGHYLGNPEHSLPIALIVGVVLAFVAWKMKKQQAGK